MQSANAGDRAPVAVAGFRIGARQARPPHCQLPPSNQFSVETEVYLALRVVAKPERARRWQKSSPTRSPCVDRTRGVLTAFEDGLMIRCEEVAGRWSRRMRRPVRGGGYSLRHSRLPAPSSVDWDVHSGGVKHASYLRCTDLADALGWAPVLARFPCLSCRGFHWRHPCCTRLVALLRKLVIRLYQRHPRPILSRELRIVQWWYPVYLRVSPQGPPAPFDCCAFKLAGIPPSGGLRRARQRYRRRRSPPFPSPGTVHPN
ncbi:hypothetical protein C8Q78DRAFT_248731 [Trametes maxima]|nr:hypothetical protein C8Q78DRAFT_248731 [Trametes maxima]